MQSSQEKRINVRFVVFGIFIIIMGVALFPIIRTLMSMSGWFEVTRDFTVPAGEHYTMTWTASAAGDMYYGYIVIEGGDNDIEFFIKDPAGDTIYDVGVVSGRHDFSFEATAKGVHKMHFDNSVSTASKSIRSVGEIALLHEPLWVEQIWTIVFVACGLILIAVGILRGPASKPQPETPPLVV